jgi:hypothetical protein
LGVDATKIFAATGRPRMVPRAFSYLVHDDCVSPQTGVGAPMVMYPSECLRPEIPAGDSRDHRIARVYSSGMKCGLERGWLGLGLALGLTTACGAGEGARPKDPTAADATASKTEGGASAALASCRSARGEGTSLVVDWGADERGDLEIAMKEGVAVVQYDCQSIRLLRDCRGEGAYAFAGETRAEQVLALNSAAEVKASLPLKGGAIGASLGRRRRRCGS